MRRALIAATLVIMVAVVGAVTLGAWVTWSYVLPEFQGASTYLSPGLKFPLATVKRVLDEAPDRDPRRLAAELGVPVVAMDAALREAFFEVPPLSVPLDGGETFHLRVDPPRPDAAEGFSYAALETRSGALLRLGPLAGLTPFQPATVLVWLGVMLAAALAASPVILLPLARQLKRLEDTARKLSAGDLGARAPLRGATRDLGHALNTMAERTERLIQSHEDLLRAVAHELRTPSARLRFHHELLQGARDEVSRRRHGESIDKDLDELDALVDEILSFEQLSAPQQLETQALVVGPVFAQLVASASELAPDKTVTQAGPHDATVQVEPRSFRRALANLLSNALRAARGRVLLSWSVTADWLEVRVDDDGPGVPPDQYERIFQPFVVGDASRSRASGGVGLGLAIVKRAVEAHGGEVTIADAPLGGARFVTSWPAPRTE